MLSEAEAMLAKEDARFLEPATLVERAGLARLDGDETAARRHLDEARRLYEEIGAPRRARALAAAIG
jgi:hypothetical protein